MPLVQLDLLQVQRGSQPDPHEVDHSQEQVPRSPPCLRPRTRKFCESVATGG